MEEDLSSSSDADLLEDLDELSVDVEPPVPVETPVVATAAAAATAPAPTPRVDAEQGLANLLRLFDERVVDGEAYVAARNAHFDDASNTFLVQCEHILSAVSAMVDGGHPHYYRVNELKRNLLEAREDASRAKQALLASVERQQANLAFIVADAVTNHLCRGPQTAPFYVADAIEETDLAILADNPALPPNPVTMRPLETRRKRCTDLFKHE